MTHEEYIEHVAKDVRDNRRKNIVAGTLIMLGLLVGFAILAKLGAPVRWGPVP